MIALPTAATQDPRVARAWAALAQIPDPEVPVLMLTDLGVVREVLPAGEAGVRVALTPTYSGCPATLAIEMSVIERLSRDGFQPVEIERRLAPAWTTDWISQAGRARLLAHGIAPPNGSASKRALLGEDAPAACPHCGSARTERVSEFGSTACKALWRCLDCREPFDYFKCL